MTDIQFRAREIRDENLAERHRHGEAWAGLEDGEPLSAAELRWMYVLVVGALALFAGALAWLIWR